MKTAAIIQARQGSSRLPGKALVDICGKPALQRVIERCRASKVNDVIVATTTNEADNAIEDLCTRLKCNIYRGSEEDVLSRVLEAAKKYDVDTIVEITADCPLIDWNHINTLLASYDMSYDLVTNIKTRTFPRGYDIRIFTRGTLGRVDAEVDNPIDRQHVSTWMYLNPEGSKNYKVLHWTAPPPMNRPDIDVTLDTPEDLELIRWLFSFEGQGYNLELTCEQVISLIDTYPEIYAKVAQIERKDYFAELKEWQDSLKALEDVIINGTSDGETKGIVSALNVTKKRGRPKSNN